VLGHAQLQRGLVSDAIGSYLLAKDSSKYIEVIKRASETQQYADLVKYLMMVRKKARREPRCGSGWKRRGVGRRRLQ